MVRYCQQAVIFLAVIWSSRKDRPWNEMVEE